MDFSNELPRDKPSNVLQNPFWYDGKWRVTIIGVTVSGDVLVKNRLKNIVIIVKMSFEGIEWDNIYGVIRV